jgi:hypothetical protein
VICLAKPKWQGQVRECAFRAAEVSGGSLIAHLGSTGISASSALMRDSKPFSKLAKPTGMDRIFTRFIHRHQSSFRGLNAILRTVCDWHSPKKYSNGWRMDGIQTDQGKRDCEGLCVARYGWHG